MVIGNDKHDKSRGRRGVRASHVMWAVVVKVLHKFPLESPSSWRTGQASGAQHHRQARLGVPRCWGSLLLPRD